MKVQNRKFPKKIAAAFVPPITISQIILTNPVIYGLLADFIINFRLINWHYTFNDQESTRQFCIDTFNLVLKDVLKKKFPPEKIKKISNLSSRVLEKLLFDPEINFYWASAAIVDITRNINLTNFLNKQSVYDQIHNARNIFLYSYKRSLPCDQKHLFTEKRICDTEYHRIFKEYGIFKRNCHLLFTEIINNILIFAIPLCFLFLIANVFKIESLSVRIGNLYYLLPLAFLLTAFSSFTNGLIVRRKVDKYSFYYSRDMFKLKDLSEPFKNSFLQFIAESFQIIKENKKDNKSVKKLKETRDIPEINKQKLAAETIEETYFETKTKNNYLIEESKVKKKTQASFPDFIGKHCNDNKQDNYVGLILNSEKLTKLIEIIWESKEFGEISFRYGHPETYKLWSNKKNLDQEVKLCFVHFPTEKLLDENDKELIKSFKKVAIIGHVVEHTGQGYIQISKNTFKIKIFASQYKAYRMPVELTEAKLIHAPINYQRCRLFIANNPINKTTFNEKYLQNLYVKKS